jgi:hypothetical protein
MAWLQPNRNPSTAYAGVSVSLSELYVPVLLEPSPYLTMYWHGDDPEQRSEAARRRPSPRHAGELQEKVEYVADPAGSNTGSFWTWHGSGTGHWRHCTHDTSLPVSKITVWVTAGVPRPTVTTYS